MKFPDADDASPVQVRANALGAAIVLRDFSRRREISFPTRRACRTLMRAQAIMWRQQRRGLNGGTVSL